MTSLYFCGNCQTHVNVNRFGSCEYCASDQTIYCPGHAERSQISAVPIAERNYFPGAWNYLLRGAAFGVLAPLLACASVSLAPFLVVYYFADFCCRLYSVVIGQTWQESGIL